MDIIKEKIYDCKTKLQHLSNYYNLIRLIQKTAKSLRLDAV